jgi:hypothetical protein
MWFKKIADEPEDWSSLKLLHVFAQWLCLSMRLSLNIRRFITMGYATFHPYSPRQCLPQVYGNDASKRFPVSVFQISKS